MTDGAINAFQENERSFLPKDFRSPSLYYPLDGNDVYSFHFTSLLSRPVFLETYFDSWMERIKRIKGSTLKGKVHLLLSVDQLMLFYLFS